ncbi:MAG: SEC-C metal-binding domain-containing protein, partial [Candidatus Cloacimonetes bacterium]|nr:SEC-C metal-binding domain-containing protein [Candidatus Cloacimonadota bacterium]
RMYDKLAGMTGTAVTEEAEFMEIYKLPVMAIPTNVPVTRKDYDDAIFLTKKEKYEAVMNEIEYWHKQGKPVLVGTVSVEVSEVLSRFLKNKKIAHSVLNAKNHESEAEIIKMAGQPGSVTIATNMAGRGTDIKLGNGVVEHESAHYQKLKVEVSESAPYGNMRDGLHVIGTERHESRRIDRQLRGRAGRQGDPGSSRFYLSLEDDLMRLFGSDRIAPMLVKFGYQEGDAITHPWMTNAVEKAQTRVESHNFEIRKQLIKYDEVMNQQREVIYNFRRNVLKGYDISSEIKEMIKDTLENVIDEKVSFETYEEDWELGKIIEWLSYELRIQAKVDDLQSDIMNREVLLANLEDIVFEAYSKREEFLGSENMRKLERHSLLSVVDENWKDHLHEMDLLKEGIGLRAYGQKDPLTEYKKESYLLFEKLISNIHESVTKSVFTRYMVSNQEEYERMMRMLRMHHSETSAFNNRQTNSSDREPVQKIQPVKVEPKTGRNEPCPCGSGKKYKNCCGKNN